MTNESNKIKSAALSGGGDKGAYTVGVLKKLYESGYRYEHIAGTSTGALIAPLLAIGKLGLLEQIYTSVEFNDILGKHDWGLRLISEGAYYDVTPLRNLVKKHITNEVFEQLIRTDTPDIYLATVCMNNKALVYFTTSGKLQSSTKYDVVRITDKTELIKAIMASSVQPLFMPVEHIKGQSFADGGVKEFTPVDILIELGSDHITAIITTPENSRYYQAGAFTDPIEIAKKTVEIMTEEIATNDLKGAETVNKGIKYNMSIRERLERAGVANEIILSALTSEHDPFWGKRLIDFKIIRPSEWLSDGLTFDKNEMKRMFEKGYATEV